MSLSVIDPIEDGVFDVEKLEITEPAHEGFITIHMDWIGNETYNFFSGVCYVRRISDNIIVFNDDYDNGDRYLIGDKSEIDNAMNLIMTARALNEEVWNATSHR